MSSKPKTEMTRFERFNQIVPVIQFVLAGVIGLVATWTTIQLTQNSQAAEIRRQSEKIDRLEKLSTNRELFDERTKAILDRLEKQESKIDRILEKK